MPPHVFGRRAPTAAALVVSVLAGLAAAGCTSDESTEAAERSEPAPSSSSQTPRPEPAAPRPRPGECHDLTGAQVGHAHDIRPAVACRASHTTQTYYVGRFDLATFPDLEPDTAAVADFVSPRCARQFARWVGGTPTVRILSRAHPVWFVPSTRDIQSGARWFRCDLVVSASDARLATLPRDTEGLLESASAMDEYGLCSRGSPERARSKAVVCDRPHSWRAFEALRVRARGSDAYPDRDRLRDTRDRCRAQARRELDYPLEWKYGWQPPTRTQWASGLRWGVCWVPLD